MIPKFLINDGVDLYTYQNNTIDLAMFLNLLPALESMSREELDAALVLASNLPENLSTVAQLVFNIHWGITGPEDADREYLEKINLILLERLALQGSANTAAIQAGRQTMLN